MARWKPTEREVVAIVARQLRAVPGVNWKIDDPPWPFIVCPICDEPITRSQCMEIERDHEDAIGFGEGRDTLENCRYVHGSCHRKKTAADKRRMAKADRQAGRTGQRARRDRRGSRIKSGPIPGTKASGIRKRMDRTVERRT